MYMSSFMELFLLDLGLCLFFFFKLACITWLIWHSDTNFKCLIPRNPEALRNSDTNFKCLIPRNPEALRNSKVKFLVPFNLVRIYWVYLVFVMLDSQTRMRYYSSFQGAHHLSEETDSSVHSLLGCGLHYDKCHVASSVQWMVIGTFDEPVTVQHTWVAHVNKTWSLICSNLPSVLIDRCKQIVTTWCSK